MVLVPLFRLEPRLVRPFLPEETCQRGKDSHLLQKLHLQKPRTLNIKPQNPNLHANSTRSTLRLQRVLDLRDIEPPQTALGIYVTKVYITGDQYVGFRAPTAGCLQRTTLNGQEGFVQIRACFSAVHLMFCTLRA